MFDNLGGMMFIAVVGGILLFVVPLLLAIWVAKLVKRNRTSPKLRYFLILAVLVMLTLWGLYSLIQEFGFMFK